MSEKKPRVVCYLNQFFGQIGGEDKADTPPHIEMKAVGPAGALDTELGDVANVVATVICGDNYINEKDKAYSQVADLINSAEPDLVVAGPAFNAGRYGMACAKACEVAGEELNIPAVSGMYEENPGLDPAKRYAYIVPTPDSAAGMRKALPQMAGLITKILKNEELGPPEEEGYFPRGQRKTLFADKRGSLRAVEMLLKRLAGEDIETELPMPVFDEVEPAPAVREINKSTVALVSSGGIVPAKNPDSIESASATKYGRYSLKGHNDMRQLDYRSIHGGYDSVYANEDGNRVVPLDVMRELEERGEVGKLHDYYYVTTGTGTSVANAKKMGEDIAQELKDSGVQAVILTST